MVVLRLQKGDDRHLAIFYTGESSNHYSDSEAEYIGQFNAGKEALWLKKFLHDYKTTSTAKPQSQFSVTIKRQSLFLFPTANQNNRYQIPLAARTDVIKKPLDLIFFACMMICAFVNRCRCCRMWHNGIPAVWLQPGTFDDAVLKIRIHPSKLYQAKEAIAAMVGVS
jgi:hypothetical protein